MTNESTQTIQDTKLKIKFDFKKFIIYFFVIFTSIIIFLKYLVISVITFEQ